jgi:hypothetical protein
MTQAAAATETQPLTHAAETPPEVLDDAWKRAEKAAEADELARKKQHEQARAKLDGKAKGSAAAALERPRKNGRFTKADDKPAAEGEKKEPEKAPDPEDAPVTTAERVAWRAERRAERQRLQQREAEFEQLVGKTRGELEQRYAPFIAAEKALKSGDLNAVAKSLGFEDWKALEKKQLERIRSPEAVRIAELEQREREREERDARARAEAEERQQREQETAVIGQYKSELSETMTKSEDQVVRALAKNPDFCDAVFQVQRANWDGETPLTPEEAIRLKDEHGATIVDRLRASYQVLHQAFGDPAAAKQEASKEAPDRSGSTPRGKSKPLSRNGAAEASPKASWSSDQEFINTWAQRLAASEDDDDDDD